MPPAEAKPFPPNLAERTVEEMREKIERDGGCLTQDLEECGFTPEEIDHAWPNAKAILEFKGRVSRR
ncbi:MAG TPA: hypothetical protein VHX61_05430 [Rhizomicrobium sp.]|jgi:hypothetical protein|nr:hypothetical protein [Rhizomicrobium sp.]